MASKVNVQEVINVLEAFNWTVYLQEEGIQAEKMINEWNVDIRLSHDDSFFGIYAVFLNSNDGELEVDSNGTISINYKNLTLKYTSEDDTQKFLHAWHNNEELTQRLIKFFKDDELVLASLMDIIRFEAGNTLRKIFEL